jgi:small subunit ribosomal protein S17
MAEKQKTLNGTVVGDKMDKTVVVRVDHTTRHRLYHKILKRSKRYLAHDDHLEAKVGDKVRIMEMRPMSRLKRWRVSEIVERGEVAELAPREIDSEYLALHREREAPPEPRASATVGSDDAPDEAPQAEEVGAEAIEAAEAVASTEVLTEELADDAAAEEQEAQQ